jgi:hypothetical protein
MTIPSGDVYPGDLHLARAAAPAALVTVVVFTGGPSMADAPPVPDPAPVTVSVKRLQLPVTPDPVPITVTTERAQAPKAPEPVVVSVKTRRAMLPDPPEPVVASVRTRRAKLPRPPEPVVAGLSIRRVEMPPVPDPQPVALRLQRAGDGFPTAWRWTAVCPSGKYKGTYEGGWTNTMPDALGRFTGAFTGSGHVGSIEGQATASSVRFVRRFGRGNLIEQVWTGTLSDKGVPGGKRVRHIEGTLTDPEGRCSFTATAQ